MWMNSFFVFITLLIIVPPIILLLGITRWQLVTSKIRARVESGRVRVVPTNYHATELEGLPAPVRRYFETVLREGQPMIAVAEIEHVGQFNLGRDGQDRWTFFTSAELVTMQRPGFDWDGRLRVLPGISIFTHDTYALGEALTRARILGLVPLPKLAPSPELARGQLMRFLAESPWYPTRLLPSQGVRWEPLDAHSARAILRDGEHEAAMIFEFNAAAGTIDRIHTDARPRALKRNVLAPTPWEGCFQGYEERSGMRIPLRGEVAWLLPEGRLPYWRGQVTELLYKFAH